MAFFGNPIVPPVDINNQSVEVPNSNGARQSRLVPLGEMVNFLYDDCKTLLEVMKRGHRLSDDGPCLGRKISKTEYSFLKYSEVIRRSKDFGCGLVEIGMEPGQSSLIGIHSQNCVEWILTEQACYTQSAVIVPIYDSFGPQACSFIMNQAEIKILICDKIEKVVSLLMKIEEIPTLKHIILIEKMNDYFRTLVQQKGLELHSFQEIEDLGVENPVPHLPPKPSDVCTICYTSGTTGEPKGVVLTHANVIANVSGGLVQMGEHIPKNGVALSVLPLAHMLERVLQATFFTVGASVAFFNGDVKLIAEDIKILKPKIMIVVPRLLNKIYDKIYAKVKESLMKKFLFGLALKMKKIELQNLVIRNDGFWDRHVFKAVRDAMGGRMELIVCGAAPLNSDVLTFFRCALGCLILEGYGQTENAAPCSSSIPGDYATEHVGPPLACCHIKLIDVPEKDYFSKNGQGEICIRGHNVFKGYYKNPEKTAETLDPEGWLHTDDIGEWLPNGTLKIIDRRKNIFKLSQGEYVAPEKIENMYSICSFVSQIFVYGHSLQSFLVAIIVPDEGNVMSWCKKKGITGSFEEVCKNEEVKQIILKSITLQGEKVGLKSFEQVKDIYLSSEMFSFENGLLTPTLKNKRPACKEYFIKEINAMYGQKNGRKNRGAPLKSQEAWSK